MPEYREHNPGTFCWNEVATTDPAAAKKFYSGLFGWTVKDYDMGPGGVYHMMQLRGLDVTGLYRLRDEQSKQGVPAHWMSYVLVDSVDEGAKRAASIGGNVMGGPMDVGDFGRMAVVVDPTGAAFALWQARKKDGVRLANEPGAPCWNELITKNADAATTFYGKLFGWTAKAGDQGYIHFAKGEQPVGGMLQIRPEMGPLPSHWLTYFAVEDADRTVAKARQLGGKVMAELRDLPNVGRFAVLQDPQGPAFGVIKLAGKM
jgi:uncharacterized protein